MREAIAKLISIIAHPIFINLLSLKLLFSYLPALSFGIPSSVAQYYIIFIFLSTSVVPLLMVVALRVIGRIESVYLKRKEERNIPYLITIVMYLFCLYNFWRSTFVVYEIMVYLVTCTILLILVFLINHRRKISIHMVTLGALAGLLIFMGFMGYCEVRYILAGVIILSGMVSSARLWLKAHQPGEIYWGFGLGSLIMFCLMLLSIIFE